MTLCCFGFSEKMLSWVEEGKENRLIFVDEKPLQIEHPRVKTYRIESPLQVFFLANKIAEEAVLLPLKIVNENNSPLFLEFEKTLLSIHRTKSLALSDVADFGCKALQNAKVNLSKPYRCLKDLEGAYSGIPAVIVGAGPSLEDHAQALQAIQDRALIIVGGHALEKAPVKAHFGAILDKEDPTYTPKDPHLPLFFQARAFPFSWQGERILAPDSHLSFINAITRSAAIDCGWTVGNFMAQIALTLGCNPIISVGMDYELRGEKKYAFDKKTVESPPSDWIEAVLWIQNLASRNPKTKFFKTLGGVEYLPEIDLAELKNGKPIQEHLPQTPMYEPLSLASWKKRFQEGKEIITQELYEPLWRLWRPVFAREFHPDQMELHKKLFFEQVKDDYLHVLD